MKKILFITRPMVPPWHEGSKKLVWMIASKLNKLEPQLLTSSQTEQLPNNSLVTWHFVYKTADLKLTEKIRLLFFLFGRMPKVDILHSYFVPSIITSKLLKAVQRWYKLPMIQTVPALPRFELTPELCKHLFYGDFIVTYSQKTANYLANLGVKNVHHVDVGMNLAKYKNAKWDETIRKQFGCHVDDVMVLFSGEYTRLGAIERLQEIIPFVLRQTTNVYFIIACRILIPKDMEVESELKQWVIDNEYTNHVYFVGEVPYFAELLKSSDVFIFPVTNMKGKIETPLTIIEAMAAGLPVICSNVADLPVAFPQESGVLFSSPKTEPFANKILEISKDKSKRQKIGLVSQSYALDRFEVDKMITSYEALYDKLI